jgi:hypothetical protein
MKHPVFWHNSGLILFYKYYLNHPRTEPRSLSLEQGANKHPRINSPSLFPSVYRVESEVFTEVQMNTCTSVSWYMTSCRLLDRYTTYANLNGIISQNTELFKFSRAVKFYA